MPKKYERDPKSGSDLLIGQMVVRPSPQPHMFMLPKRDSLCREFENVCNNRGNSWDGPLHESRSRSNPDHIPRSGRGLAHLSQDLASHAVGFHQGFHLSPSVPQCHLSQQIPFPLSHPVIPSSGSNAHPHPHIDCKGQQQRKERCQISACQFGIIYLSAELHVQASTRICNVNVRFRSKIFFQLSKKKISTKMKCPKSSLKYT